MKRDWCDKEFRILMTMGESTTAGGWSSSRERCWANQLARSVSEVQRVPVQLVNVGIGANLISTKSPKYHLSGKPAADERLEKHVLSNSANGNPIVPDLLLISYGLNDARGGTPRDLFCLELEKIVDRVRQRFQPLIVLLGPYYVTEFGVRHGVDWSHATLKILNQFNDDIKALAERKNCLFVNVLAAYADTDWLVHGDGVHANDLGHRVVANAIFQVLATNCSGLAAETKEMEKYIAPWRDESTLQQ